MSNQIYCFKDRQFYVKTKTGIEIRLQGNTIRQRGDLYICPSCKNEVIGDFGVPYD